MMRCGRSPPVTACGCWACRLDAKACSTLKYLGFLAFSGRILGRRLRSFNHTRPLSMELVPVPSSVFLFHDVCGRVLCCTSGNQHGATSHLIGHGRSSRRCWALQPSSSAPRRSQRSSSAAHGYSPPRARRMPTFDRLRRSRRLTRRCSLRSPPARRLCQSPSRRLRPETVPSTDASTASSTVALAFAALDALQAGEPIGQACGPSRPPIRITPAPSVWNPEACVTWSCVG